MKLPKYNLGYNTRDQLRSLAISASERKQIGINKQKIINIIIRHTNGEVVAFIVSVLKQLHRNRLETLLSQSGYRFTAEKRPNKWSFPKSQQKLPKFPHSSWMEI